MMPKAHYTAEQQDKHKVTLYVQIDKTSKATQTSEDDVSIIFIIYATAILPSPTIPLPPNSGFGGTYPYIYTEASTTMAPIQKLLLTWMSWKYMADTTAERRMEMDVAKPLRTLSAYLTTIATSYLP